MKDLLRIAFFSPLPPAHTGIADYCQELLPHLASHLDLTLFTEEPDAVTETLRQKFPILPLSAYPSTRYEFDLALYQMGNSAHHESMYQMLRHYPGVTVLHDYWLHHFMVHSTVGQGRYPGYVREMGYAMEMDGVRRARQVRLHQQPYPYQETPLNARLLDLSLGLIVHSQTVRDMALAYRPDLPAIAIPAPIGPHRPNGQASRPTRWPSNAVVMASLGLVSTNKHIDHVLAALVRVQPTVPQLRYLIVGDWIAADLDVPAAVHELHFEDVVAYTGFVEDLGEFEAWLNLADFVVNLREPTLGETSAGALRALAAGRPLIVYDHGWYAELPDDVCLKVPVGNDAALEQAIARLAQDDELRRQMGARAAQYVAANHSAERAAASYAEFLETVLRRLNG